MATYCQSGRTTACSFDRRCVRLAKASRVRTERVVQKLGDLRVVLRRLDNVFVGANQDERCAKVVFLLRTGGVHHDGVEPEPQRSQRMLPRGDAVWHVGESIWKAPLGVRDKLPHVEQLAEE